MPADAPDLPLPGDFGIGRLFELIRDAVIVANARTERICLWNPAAAGLLGYPPEEAVGMPLHAIVPEELRERHRAGLANYERTGRGELIDAKAPVELEGLHKSGHRVAVELTLSPLEAGLNGSEGRYVLAILRDISERKRLEDYQLRIREAELARRHAVRLNDDVLQSISLSLYFHEAGHTQKALEMSRKAIKTVQDLMRDLLERAGSVTPGDLVREAHSHTATPREPPTPRRGVTDEA